MQKVISTRYLRYLVPLFLVAMGALAGIIVAILVSNLIIGGA